MNHQRAALIVSLATVAMWLWVLWDAWSFHLWASEYFADSRSINADNDLVYAQTLLAAAGCGASLSLACSLWLALRPSLLAYPLQAWTTGFGIAFLLGDHAGPVHLFPTGMPLVHLFAATAVAAIPLEVIAWRVGCADPRRVRAAP